VSAPKYPSSWGGVDPFPGSLFSRGVPKNEDVCPLTGAYADSGEPAPGYEERKTPSLSTILHRVFPDRLPDASSVKEVRFDGPRDGKLVISEWNQGTQVLSLTITRMTEGVLSGHYDCRNNGSVAFALSQAGEFATVGIAQAQDVLLARGANGWLIVKTNRLDAGTAALILFGGRFERRWYRFPPVPTSLPSGDRPETH